MKGSLRIAYVLMAFIVIAAGCTGSAPEKQVKKQEVLISGSGSGADILKPLAAEFEKKNPEIKIRFLASTSTGDGITGVGEGTLDIASLARKMKDSEKAKYPDLAEGIYVKDAMILGVNPELNVTGITGDEVRGIHAGNITDWSEVGGPGGKIVLLIREESESSTIVLREKFLGKINITPAAIMLYSSGSTNEAIEEGRFAVGQASLGTIKMKGLAIKPLAIDGVMPSPDTVKSGAYPMIRDYGIAYRKGGASDATKKFVDFLFSSDAARILSGYDFVPVPRE